jgi:hypothetical protein
MAVLTLNKLCTRRMQPCAELSNKST